MTLYRAIMAVSEAIVGLLRSSYRPKDLNNNLEFKVFTSKDHGLADDRGRLLH